MKEEGLRTCYDCIAHQPIFARAENHYRQIVDYVFCLKKHDCAKYHDAIICDVFEGEEKCTQ